MQIEIVHLQATRSWGTAGRAFRNSELSQLQAGKMDDLVVDELDDIESRFGGKYADVCNDALEEYLK